MVEFAIILPLLVLLLVMAIDFGRVFFGWIALQNTARIGADWAAQTAESWPDASDPDDNRGTYQTLMINDLEAANCEYSTPLPPPVFTDGDDPPDGQTQQWGDLATVELECEFGLITPLAEGILGGPVVLQASSTFMVHGTTAGALPEAPPPPCDAPVADIDTDPPTSGGGRVNISGTGASLQVTFTDLTPETGSCPITVRTWDFDDGSPTQSDDEVTHQFPPHTGGGHTDYDVVLTIETAEGTDTATVRVRVSQ